MNLYLISQDENGGYDTYDAAVVCAESEEQARLFDPHDDEIISESIAWKDKYSGYWANSPEKVTVKFLGKADSSAVKGVVLASFNAG